MDSRYFLIGRQCGDRQLLPMLLYLHFVHLRPRCRAMIMEPFTAHYVFALGNSGIASHVPELLLATTPTCCCWLPLLLLQQRSSCGTVEKARAGLLTVAFARLFRSVVIGHSNLRIQTFVLRLCFC